MNERNEKKKPFSAGKLIGLLVILFSLPGELIGVLIVLGIIGYAVYLAVKAAGKKDSSRKYTTRTRENFDDCPKPICFHKDKGMHHVRRGKEIDPWDRPDIDISKYQRR